MAEDKGYKRETGSMYIYPNGEKMFVPWQRKKEDEGQGPVNIELVSIGKHKIYATKHLIKMELSFPRCPLAKVPGMFIRTTQKLLCALVSSKVASKLYDVAECIEEEESTTSEEKEEEFDPEYDRFG